MAGDVDHSDLKVRKRKGRIQLQTAPERFEPLVSPGRIAEPEVVAPALWLESDRFPSRSLGFVIPTGRREQIGERGMSFSQLWRQGDTAAGVLHRRGEQARVRGEPGPSTFVLPAPRVGAPYVGGGKAWVKRDRPVEVVERSVSLRAVKPLELQPASARGSESIKI